jgi:CheY-like chemotaxis protein
MPFPPSPGGEGGKGARQWRAGWVGEVKGKNTMNGSSKKILVIDDDEAIRESTKYFLKNEGYLVTAARNGDEALDLFAHSAYDLVISDIFMPGTDGLDTIAEMKKRNIDLKILAISGVEMKDEFLEMAGMYGAGKKLSKPFSRQQLVKTVAEMFGEEEKGKDELLKKSLSAFREGFNNARTQ